MGLARANEVLLLRKTLQADDLVQCGFVKYVIRPVAYFIL